ncbi:hypothetical protein ACFSO7_17265 [Bacillus sp. CGMCC 1.16607]|uniref:hypothetical protein n=1 Tax=Bacillus sp. CGMCC 1.16607 TaxID=3351842 RepID=UPI003633E49D
MYSTKVWVRKWKSGEPFDTRSVGENNPLKSRARKKFNSAEEERDYLKEQVDYFKKAVPKSDKGGEDILQRLKYEIIEELRGTYPTR